jgi:hypothetical protein
MRSAIGVTLHRDGGHADGKAEFLPVCQGASWCHTRPIGKDGRYRRGLCHVSGLKRDHRPLRVAAWAVAEIASIRTAVFVCLRRLASGLRSRASGPAFTIAATSSRAANSLLWWPTKGSRAQSRTAALQETVEQLRSIIKSEKAKVIDLPNPLRRAN